ncbi:MAG: hypothetical protein ACOYN4_15100 [Bacteroidales bacterium]
MPNFTLKSLKPGVPKVVLIALGAALWGFAAFRILKMGFIFIEKHALNHLINYLIGFAGFVPFFLLVFRKVSLKYITRIKNLPQKRPCMFAFFDVRGYVMMSFMITMGIAFSHWEVIPELYKGTFFISLGLSLLASSVFYIVEGVQFVRNEGE